MVELECPFFRPRAVPGQIFWRGIQGGEDDPSVELSMNNYEI